jgi:DNA-directed RNA polymerase subunit RPC12/RpoP
MAQEKIQVLCNRCNARRFIVIKPPKELSPSNLYYACTDCLRKHNRENYKSINIEIK